MCRALSHQSVATTRGPHRLNTSNLPHCVSSTMTSSLSQACLTRISRSHEGYQGEIRNRQLQRSAIEQIAGSQPRPKANHRCNQQPRPSSLASSPTDYTGQLRDAKELLLSREHNPARKASRDRSVVFSAPKLLAGSPRLSDCWFVGAPIVNLCSATLWLLLISSCSSATAFGHPLSDLRRDQFRGKGEDGGGGRGRIF